jgi:hypothetical protein
VVVIGHSAKFVNFVTPLTTRRCGTFFGVDVFDRCADAGRAQGPEQKRDFVALDQLPGPTLAA